MKIIDLYKLKRVPIVTFLILILCIIVTGLYIFDKSLYETLACMNNPKYFWQYFSGVFLHGMKDSNNIFIIVHFISTMLIIVPYGIIIENILGLKKTFIIFLISLLGFILTFQLGTMLFLNGEDVYGAGASGIGYSFATVGTYILYQIYKMNKKVFFKQVLSYVFMLEIVSMIIILSPFTAGIASMIIHLMGIVMGIIGIIVYKKDIKKILITKK